MTNENRDQHLDSIYKSLQSLLGYHRQLMEVVRGERDALASAEVKRVQDSTLQKEALVASIRQCEQRRLEDVSALALFWKRPLRELTLSQIIIAVQGFDLKRADALRSVYQSLQVLVSRIQEQNRYNRELVEKSLSNLDLMKRNVLGESAPKTSTYDLHGQKSNKGGSSRLISREA